MNQSSLLPQRDATIDRPLIAFAFLAQTTQVQGDLMSGLAPIFKPIVKQNVGRRFDAREFADKVAKLYGINIHPWAVDDLAVRLEKANLLVRNQLAAGADSFEYVYGNVEETFDEVTEAHIRHVVEKFIEFSSPVIQGLGGVVDEKVLEEGFFDEIIAIDFHSIHLKPDRKETKASTLTIKKSPEEQEKQRELSARAHLDVLCAAFLVDAYHKNRDLYDLVARIATGAMLSQVVLNIQDPGKTVSLLTLRVVLDAPFVMSLLDLSSEESTNYARDLKTALTDHEATVEVFRHSLEEIKDNLKAVMTGVAEGIGFGATARRLQKTTFGAYATGVMNDLESAVTRIGVRIVEPPKLPVYYQYFTEADEDQFCATLGSYWNLMAQRRDAASIAGVMRFRQGKRARTSAFHQAGSVFVTQNPRLADCSARMVIARKLALPNEVPPAVTDRFLAGLIWVLYGGKAADLTRSRLISSCTAALEIRNDVMTKMQSFLSQVDETKAIQFRAMMTSERAGQHLMQLTLGDSALVNSTTDAERVYAELESKMEAKHKAAADEAISEIRKSAEEVVRQIDAEREKQAQAARDAEINELVAKQELEAERRRAEEDRLEREAAIQRNAELIEMQSTALKEKHAEERERWIAGRKPALERCVRLSLGRMRQQTHLLALAIGLLAFLAAYLGTEFAASIDRRLAIAGAFIAGVIAVVAFWENPRRFFQRRIVDARDRRFNALVDEYQLRESLSEYSIDWDSGAVSRSSERKD